MNEVPFIELRSGKAFTPTAPRVEDIHIEDIAHALSNQCRFSGHTQSFYSVAEHCVRVSWLLETWDFDRATALWGLLHDASEAYLVDLPAPLKVGTLLGFEYLVLEKRVQRAICERFGLSDAEPLAVRIADRTMLATEARDLMAYTPGHWDQLTCDPVRTPIGVPWSPRQAKEVFLRRFEVLS